MRTFFFLLMPLFLCLNADAATVTWTGGGDGTSWEDASNWDMGVPGPLDEAIIGSTDAVTLTSEVSILDLTLNN